MWDVKFGSGFRIRIRSDYHKIDGKFSRQRCLDLDLDPVCSERLDPVPVNNKPDQKLWL